MSSKAMFLMAALLAAGSAPASDALVDPTRPTALSAARPERAEFARVETGPRWRLQSTLVARERRLAVINGRSVRLGGTIDGATLREVRADGVVLDAGGRRIDLRLKSRGYPVKRENRR